MNPISSLMVDELRKFCLFDDIKKQSVMHPNDAYHNLIEDGAWLVMNVLHS